MDELIEILEGINPEVDYSTCETLVADGVLTSFEVVMLVTQIEAARILPENFNSAARIWALIEELEGEE